MNFKSRMECEPRRIQIVQPTEEESARIEQATQADFVARRDEIISQIIKNNREKDIAEGIFVNIAVEQK